MFDVITTRAWWDFFHRFSLIYQGSNFDYIILLGINLLECYQCLNDGSRFYRTIGPKSPVEKINILHNYVNRKLHTKIFTLVETKESIKDVLLPGTNTPNWNILIDYYFNLLFRMTNYLKQENLKDLKELSAFIYQSVQLPKSVTSLAINVTPNDKFDQEILKMQVFEYYSKFKSSIKNLSLNYQPPIISKSIEEISKPIVKSYSDIFGSIPKQIKTCNTCAKKHQLYLENHNTPNNIPPKSITKPIINQNIQIVKTPLNTKTIQFTIKNESQALATSKELVKSEPVINPVIKQFIKKINPETTQIIKKKIIPINKTKSSPTTHKRQIILKRSRKIFYPQNIKKSI